MKALVEVHKCSAYDSTVLRTLLAAPIERAFHRAGVGRGSTVLLKPNLMGPHPPERAVTTHPEVVRAVAELLADCGVHTLVGDSPASGRFEETLAVCGLTPVLQHAGAKAVCFETSGVVDKQVGANVYHLSRVPFEVDAVVNLPKLKTHASALYTGAVKNLFGCIPGLGKRTLHERAPAIASFATHLRAIHALLEPRICLHVMDGIVGMDGLGPVRGRAAPFGRLLVSHSGLALDRIACALLGLDWMEVEHLKTGDALAVETSPADALDTLRIEGARLDAPRVAGWIARHGWSRARSFRRQLLWARPAVDRHRCVGCGDCARLCPTGAIAVDNRARAIIVRDRCISCLCCTEVCSHRAVAVHLSRTARGMAIVGWAAYTTAKLIHIGPTLAGRQ